jgi:hypothetical protein
MAWGAWRRWMHRDLQIIGLFVDPWGYRFMIIGAFGLTKWNELHGEWCLKGKNGMSCMGNGV